jgi:hypothetical protein
MMNETEGRPSEGQDQPESIELGGPTRIGETAERAEEPRPDLDERHRRISERRKAMGPPLAEPEAPREEDFERSDRGPEEPPADPA